MVPEILQEHCTPERLAAALDGLLSDPGKAASQRAAFGPVLASLAPGSGTPSEAAADAILEMIRVSPPRHSR